MGDFEVTKQKPMEAAKGLAGPVGPTLVARVSQPCPPGSLPPPAAHLG